MTPTKDTSQPLDSERLITTGIFYFDDMLLVREPTTDYFFYPIFTKKFDLFE